MTNFRKLGRPTDHHMSMLRTMVSQLVKHECIETTITKAKEVRRLADNMVQLGKDGSLCAARRAAAFVRGDDVLHKLFNEAAYRFKDRAGGYTRVLRTRIRVGDAAPMAYIEDATMTPTRNALNRVLLSIKPLGTMLSSSPTKFRFFSTIDEATSGTATAAAALPTQSTVPSNPRDASDVFRDWGCTEADIHRIFTRQPKLRNCNLPKLEYKLRLLRELGLEPSDLVSIIHRRPRFLNYDINRYFDDRLHLEAFFGSRKMLIKAIVRSPSVLTCDFQKTFTPVVEMYAQLGIGKSDLIPLLLSRPALIPYSKFCEDKLDYISRTGVSRESKMYKYVVVVIAVSRVETIRVKLAHFQKFGFSKDEILKAVGRSPMLLTLSMEKVQRNMTFVVATIRLPAKDALDHPFLLFRNLDTLLKPRMHLACKIDEMELFPRIKGPDILRALSMTDDRFVKVFISCHPPDVREKLMECFRDAKGVKRLAVSSKKNTSKWYSF